MTVMIAQHMAAALAPFQGEDLLSRESLARIAHEVAGHLPAAMTRYFGFECRLGDALPTADFVLRIDGPGEQWQALEQYASVRDAPAWGRIGSFVAGRNDPQSAWRGCIDNMWLEFDLASRDGSALPSVFFGTDRLVAREGASLAFEWVKASISALQGQPLQPARARVLGAIVAALPPGAQIFQVGMMLSRADAPLRICVGDVAAEGIADFLNAVGWPGPIASVERALHEAAPFMSHMAVGLDVGDDGVTKKLGLEIYAGGHAGAGQRLLGLIRLLAGAGFLLPGKAAGLLAWDGITHQRLHAQQWPADLLAEKAACGTQDSSAFVRWINHFKLGFDGDRTPVAKAYLAVSHRLLTNRAIREAMRQTT